MATTYTTQPNNGALLLGPKRHEKSPDYFGTLIIDLNTVKPVNGMLTVKLSGWVRPTSNGKHLVHLSVDTWQPDPNYHKSTNHASNPQAMLQGKAHKEVSFDDGEVPF